MASVAVPTVLLVEACFRDRARKQLTGAVTGIILNNSPVHQLSPLISLMLQVGLMSMCLLAICMYNAEYPGILFEAVVCQLLAFGLQTLGMAYSSAYCEDGRCKLYGPIEYDPNPDPVRRRCILFAVFGSVLPLQAAITWLSLAPVWGYTLRFVVGGFGMLLWLSDELHPGAGAAGNPNVTFGWLNNAILLPLHLVPWLMVVLSWTYLHQPDRELPWLMYIPILSLVVAKVAAWCLGFYAALLWLVHGVLISVICGIYSVWWVGLTTVPYHLFTSVIFAFANGVPH